MQLDMGSACNDEREEDQLMAGMLVSGFTIPRRRVSRQIGKRELPVTSIVGL